MKVFLHSSPEGQEQQKQFDGEGGGEVAHWVNDF